MIIMNSWQLFAVVKERELEQGRLQSALELFSSCWLDSSESSTSCYNVLLAGQVVLRFLFHDVLLQIAMK